MIEYKYKYIEKGLGGWGLRVGGCCAQGCGLQLLHISRSAWVDKTGVVWWFGSGTGCSDQRQAQVDGSLDALPLVTARRPGFCGVLVPYSRT